MSTLAEGSVVGGCRVESVIGRGGMGIVYCANQVALARRVALKVIAPEFAEDPEFRERFQDEWRAAGGLDHPAIVPVYQAGEESGRLFVVMRYVQGTDLRALIDRERVLPGGRATAIIEQIAGALDEAHRHRLIHRDVKPANILIASDAQGRDRAFLTDFGLTRHATSAVARRTNTGQWVGTPDYIAPEQVEGRQIDGRADVYALGCVLYEALTGVLPFPHEQLVAKVMARLQGPAPAPSTQRPDLASFDAVIGRALARNPDERYATAGEFARDAAQAAARMGGAGTQVGTADEGATRIEPRPTEPLQGAAGWVPGAAAAGAAGAAAYGGAHAGHQPGGTPDPGGPPPGSPGGAAQHGGAPTAPVPPGGGYGQPPTPPGGQGAYGGAPGYGGGWGGAGAQTPAYPGGAGYGAQGQAVPPRRKSRAPLIAGIIVGVLVLAGAGAAVVALSGSDETKTLNRAQAESKVASFVGRRLQLDNVTGASCPSDVPQQSGKSFTCVARDSDTDRITVRATQTDDKGTLSQTVVKAIYASEYIEDNAKAYYDKQRSAGRINYSIRTVTCPPRFEARAGEKFSCPVVFTDNVRNAFPVTITSAVNGRYRIGYRLSNGKLR
jgi:hypothetical protein